MDENNNNVNETDTPDNSSVYERANDAVTKPVSAFEMPEDNPTAASSEPKTYSTPTPTYYTTPAITTNSSEKDSATNTSQSTYYSYNNAVSEPAEFSTGFAIASLVMGILSILTCCCCGLGILMSILGIIFGCIQSKDESGKKPGMATAGIVTSIIGILLSIVMIVIFVITGALF